MLNHLIRTCALFFQIRDTNEQKVAELFKLGNCSEYIGQTNEFTIKCKSKF